MSRPPPEPDGRQACAGCGRRVPYAELGPSQRAAARSSPVRLCAVCRPSATCVRCGATLPIERFPLWRDGSRSHRCLVCTPYHGRGPVRSGSRALLEVPPVAPADPRADLRAVVRRIVATMD